MRKIGLVLILLIALISISSVCAAGENIGSDSAINDTTNEYSNETFTGTFSELSDLIENAKENETLELNKDHIENDFNKISITKPITVNGNGHVLDANNKSQIFFINASNVILKNLVFVNMISTTTDGGVSIYGDNCIVQDCNFINCSAKFGGAIYGKGNDITIINSTFTNCNSEINPYGDPDDNQGCAIYAKGNNWTVMNSIFENCSGFTGSAIYGEGSDWNLKNNTFTKCYSRYYGGAIYSPHGYNKYGYDIKNGDNWTIEDSTFIECSSYAGGGAVYSNGKKWNIINTTFIKCSTNFRGGAIYTTESNIYIKDSTFTRCNAKDNGGAIYLKGETPIMSNNHFKTNTAKEYPNFYSRYEVINPITAANLKTTYTINPEYQIKIYDTNGKLVNGAKVVVKLNGKSFKTLKTTKGIAKFKVTQAPGTYKLTITALDNTETKTLTVNHAVTLKGVSVKKSAKSLTLSATLKAKKVLKNKQVTFKFNGKTYKAKTNSKGIAKVTIKNTVLKKLKVGKKITYQAAYLKDTVKKTVKVQK